MKMWVPVRTVVLAAALALLAGCGGAGSSGTSSASTSIKSAVSLSGAAPTTATVGQLYSFTPSVIGGNGSLTFSIQNAPSWATFSTSSGTLAGTPQAADVGTDSNIIISVSDSQGKGSLPAFSITVAQGGSGSANATVSWTAPTTTTNGLVLTGLAGYHIYYAASASAFSDSISVPQMITVSSGVTSYVFEGLTPGTWYFAVTSYTSTGGESALSNIASLTIT